METTSQEFILGENIFHNRQEAIHNLVTSVVSELGFLDELKKGKSNGMNHPKLDLTQDTILTNINRSIELLRTVVPEEYKTQALLDNLFKGSGRKPIVREVENEADVLEIANALIVMSQSIREIYDMFKTYQTFQYQSVNLAASLLREPDKSSGISMVQKALNCYSKLSKLKGYKEWERQNGRFRSETYINKLHSLAKPRILDVLVARNLDLTTSFECFLNYLPLDIAKYSELLRTQVSIPKV